MISLLPPILLLIGALTWAGFTFKKQSDIQTEMTRLEQAAADLPKLRARNADLRELQTLPQEIERLKRENAQLPDAQAEFNKLTQRKAVLEKELAEKKDSLQQEHLSRLLNANRALSEELPAFPSFPVQPAQAAPNPAVKAPTSGL
jgi:septal ring factor EnvC (AmiA/AmiB activator)